LGKTFTQNTSVNFDEIDSVKILFSNFVPGCTMLFNRKLLESVMPFPQEAVMHDWWLMINAFLHGKFAYISEPTMYYRQHSSNVIGARKRSLWNIVFKGDGFSRLKEFNRDFNAVVVQAGCVDYIGGDERVTKAILNAKSYFGMTRISKVNFIKCYSNASLIRKLSLCLLVLFQP
jgi:hypothetical protein